MRRLVVPIASLLLLAAPACKDEPKSPAAGDKSTDEEAAKAEAPEETAKAEAPEEAPEQVAGEGELAEAKPAAEGGEAAPAGEEGEGDAVEAAPAGEEGEAAEAAPKTKLAAGAGPVYELLETGSGPKTKLRFSPKKGQVELMQLTMTMEISLDFGAAMPAQTQKTPPLKLVNKAETLEVSDSKITERIVFDRFEVDASAAGDAAMAAAMQKAMGEMKGFEQEMVYDRRGTVLEGELKVSPDANPQLAQSLENIGNTLEQVMVRFPEEAVGVGAKWTETSELDNSGAKIEQVATYELTEVEGDAITLETTIEQTPKTKDFKPPGMPPNVKVELVEFDSKGEGRIVYNLGNMLPDEGESKMDTKVKVAADANGQKQEFTTRIKLNLTLERIEE